MPVSKSWISRREFVGQSIVAASLFAGSRLLGQQRSSTSDVVRTPLGKLRGTKERGVQVFRGIPFAEPPVGRLRFRPPQAKKAWTGERDATVFSASPMQKGERGVAHSEDCLYLNLWKPEGKGPFPVFVWIHGGGFTDGHAFEPIYDGAEFARQGIVCISVGYRLGVFGFLDMEPLLGQEYAGTANNGVLDLITALDWVRNNVASFGGDAGKVTIGGESAGAKLTDILMGVPEAMLLFQQMISESGGAERVWPKEIAEGVGRGFGQAWQKATSDSPTNLLTAAADSIIAVQTPFLEGWPQHFPLRPEVDGNVLPWLPVQGVSTGTARGKRLLIGTNRDESALFIGTHPAQDPVAQNLGNTGLAAFDESFFRYKEVYPEMTDEQRRIRAVTAEEYWVPSIRVTDAHVKAGGRAWMYELAFAESGGRYSGFAYHSLDVGLVWEKPHADIANAGAEAALATQMHDAWVTFIKGGVPAAAGLPEWPEYRAGSRATMILDSVSRVEEQPQEAELRLWDGKL